MNPGEVWSLPDGSLRVVLSNATYNESRLGRVITGYVGDPSRTFQPFAVDTVAGTAYADRVTMHPRSWLAEPVAVIADDELAMLRRHLGFLLGD